MDLLDAVRAQIERGDREGARQALAEFVRGNPDSVAAWLLLSSAISDPVQQAACYRRGLDLDPGDPEATHGLESLSEVPLRCPQCGGKMVVQLVGKLKDKRATCQH